MVELKCLPTDNFDVSSEYGKRIYKNMTWHSGIDLRPKTRGVAGDNIYSVSDGVIRVAKVDGAGINRGYGRYIVVEHDGYCTLYAHLSGFNCKVGDVVKANGVIGFMGTTGDSTGVHLHFEIRIGGYNTFWIKKNGIPANAINPRPYLEQLSLSIDDCKKILIDRAKLDENSIKFLEFYKYSDELMKKLTKAIVEND